MIERKKIDTTKGRDVLARLNEVPEPVLSARQFMVENFDAIQKSGKSLKALHQFLLNNGVDVGSYKYFREIYNRVKRKREDNPAEQTATKQLGSNTLASAKKIQEPETSAEGNVDKTQNSEIKNEKKIIPYSQRPIRGADGVDYRIDPNTGARTFDPCKTGGDKL